jgi:voltage-gated potassium channel
MEHWLEGPMRFLSFAWLMLVFGQLLKPKTELLQVFGTAIWAVFILEFAVRFALAPAKLRFLKRNWLTALALLVPALRLARVFIAFRFLGLLGGGQILVLLGTVNRTMNALRAGMGRRKVAFVAALTIIVMLIGAAGMLSFEPHAAATGTGGFAGYGDALWWTAMLMTTIGSAYWPVTTAGRVLAFMLSVYSIGVFGYVTAALSSVFIGQDAENSNGPVAGSDEIAALRQDIAALRAEIVGTRPAAAERPEGTPAAT